MDNLNELIEKYKLPAILSLVGIVLIVGGVFSSGILSKPKSYPKSSLVNQPVGEIKVDLSGAVLNPGVYAIPAGSRVEDVIKVAGGFSQNASSEYIAKKLNMSAKLSDGMKLYIPFEGENYSTQVAAQSSKVSINNSPEKELDSLPGVGPSTVAKIIQNRPYDTPESLVSKKSVSRAVFEKIKDLIEL